MAKKLVCWKDRWGSRTDCSYRKWVNQKVERNKSDHITTGFEIKRLLSLILRQKDGEKVMAIPFLHERRVEKAMKELQCLQIYKAL